MNRALANIIPPLHGDSLADDLVWIQRQLRHRRRTLKWLASAAGSALWLPACGGGGIDSAGTGAATSSGTTSTGTSTGSGTTTGATTGIGSCGVPASETAGPYPGDGTNSAAGATSDVLTASGVVRSDIRSSFINSSNTAAGVPMTLTITLANANAACAVLAGCAVYLWHCDRDGNYSLYTAPAESYLRGVQISDASGVVSFTTIFPGCYSGRWPHMHFEVFASASAATSGRNAILTSQFALPAAICSEVYAGASGYTSSRSNFAAASLGGDNVFGDNTSAQMAVMTPTVTGAVATGYTATATIGLAI